MSDDKKASEAAEIAIIKFGEGAEEGIAVVRQLGTTVALCLSLRDNGDTEAILDPDSARKLLDAIRVAADRASAQTPDAANG